MLGRVGVCLRSTGIEWGSFWDMIGDRVGD